MKFVDPATGAEVKTLTYPGDAGRALRAIVEVFAPVRDAQATTVGRTITVTLRSDAGAGRSDPIVARESTQVPAALLTPELYGTNAKPRFTARLSAVMPVTSIAPVCASNEAWSVRRSESFIVAA